MSLLLSYHPETLRNECSQFESHFLLSCFLPIYVYFDNKIHHQRIQTTRSHASRCQYCHYCNVDFVLFHNVTCYTNSLLSHIHVNTVELLDVTCILIAISMIWWSLECIILVSKKPGVDRNLCSLRFAFHEGSRPSKSYPLNQSQGLYMMESRPFLGIHIPMRWIYVLKH